MSQDPDFVVPLEYKHLMTQATIEASLHGLVHYPQIIQPATKDYTWTEFFGVTVNGHHKLGCESINSCSLYASNCITPLSSTLSKNEIVMSNSAPWDLTVKRSILEGYVIPICLKCNSLL